MSFGVFLATDKEYLELCLKLALNGRGLVEPNPMVGALIVKNESIIAKGWHEVFGGPHAEANTINNCGQDLSGSTLYCNLEPCCHTNKKTPPCAPLIIDKKIARVVLSTLDPNPNVNGKGINMLKNAGITVDIGLLEKEALELNKKYFQQFE